MILKQFPNYNSLKNEAFQMSYSPLSGRKKIIGQKNDGF